MLKPVTEQELAEQDRRTGAPRVTREHIEASIAKTYFFTAGHGVQGTSPLLPIHYDEQLNLLTICVLVLTNGFTVTGESACADARNFDPEIGKRIALAKAKEKLWPLLGYDLRNRLAMVEAASPPTTESQTTHVGTKVIHAKPMTRGEYCQLRDWATPVGEDPNDAGYLVEYADGGKPNDPRFRGYISWSPADVFERAYDEVR